MDSYRFDLRLLLAFEAIHRLGSLTAAGQAVGMSQPALSHALGRMRSTFGDPLFVRTSHGMLPTPRADELAVSVRRIMAFVRAELTARSPFDPSALNRVFTLGMSDIAQMVFLPKLIGRLRAEAPHCDINVTSLASRDMAAALEAGVVDIAVGRFPDMKGASLQKEDLFKRGYLCLISGDHPRLRRSKISKDQFVNESHLVVSSPGRVEEAFEQFLKARGVRRRILVKVPHALCIPSILSHSDLIATVPHSVAVSLASHSALRVAEPPIQPAPISVAQHWSTRFAQDPAITWLRGIIGNVFKDHAQ